ncbi:MAG: hypothetical protein HY815_10140 [Candidatus Riflebacteria bacterium]|nr:hypothetical protein [Candidatus Riflebacteria bacterium]
MSEFPAALDSLLQGVEALEPLVRWTCGPLPVGDHQVLGHGEDLLQK